MLKENISFLIECDRQAIITNTFWYKPVHLLSPYQRNFLDLFADGDKERVHQLIIQAFSQESVLSCDGSFNLISPNAKISICMMQKRDNLLIHGLEYSDLMEKGSYEAVSDTIHSFMKVIKDSDADLVTENETMVRFQFEQIQKLNNELINMQRQVKKANSKLNQLNKDLNNRLVKDALTGLVSRYQYREEIELLIDKDPEALGIFTFIDLDCFKKINDTFGHRAGDDYLKEFANRLGKLSYENIISMRISGDEFGLYIHGYETVSLTDIENIWKELKEKVLKEPIKLETNEVGVFCSAGMAIYGRDTKDIYDLIEYADFAMYEAKNSGKNSYSEFNLQRYNNKNTSIL